VEQIIPHIEKLELLDALIKFTGDGWMLMTDRVQKVPALCCLAIIMANRFQVEMNERTGIAISHVPRLRLAVCSGRDVSVDLPDGRRDWVGDSARRAMRASVYCGPNETLVDEPIRYIVFRDFNIESVDIQQRLLEYQPKKREEMFPVYVLGELKLEDIEPESPGCFLYTLEVIKKEREARTAVRRVVKRLTDKTRSLAVPDKESVLRILSSWNRLMASVLDYSSVLEILDGIRTSGLVPDVVTYTTLINKAPDYDVAEDWVKVMRKERIQPDVVTYTTLIDKAPDYDVAEDWVKVMRKERIQPDVVTYNTLIDKAPDYDVAEDWVKVMREEGIQPNVFTYTTLIDKAPDYDVAKDWVNAMRKERIQPNVVTYTTLIDKAPDYDVAKDWVKVMREEGIQPDVVTYNTLIDKAPDYDVAKDWVNAMREEGIQPDVVTYTTLINKAPDYDVAKDWVNAMRKERIQPNVFTYTTLIDKAPDYDVAKDWVNAMRKERIQPNVFTYCTLFSKDLSRTSADDILKWYLAQEYHPEEGIQTAIASYRKARRIDQALRLTLDYPHLQAARKLIRAHKEEALSYFQSVSDSDSRHCNASYALGLALMEVGREGEARPHLKKALRLATATTRKTVIREWLRQIDRKRSEGR